MAERKLRSKGWDVIELDERVFRKSLAQFIGKRSRASVVPCIRQGERNPVQHITACRARLAQIASPSCFGCVAEQGFPQGRQSSEPGGSFFLLGPFGGIQRRGGNLAGVRKPPEIRCGFGLVRHQRVFYSRWARRPRRLLRHALPIV